MEDFVLIANIAIGIIQMLCLNYENRISVSSFRHLRTSSHSVMSEAIMFKDLGRSLFRFMAEQDTLTMTKIIFSRQIPDEPMENDRLLPFYVIPSNKSFDRSVHHVMIFTNSDKISPFPNYQTA